MKVVCLVENTSMSEKIEAEHGLSLYIETGKHKILFDMGQSDLFARNAKTLDVDLSDVDIAVLSHGHYDHGGGLNTFLDINSKAKVYISTYAFCPHYNGTTKYIGLDEGIRKNERLIFTDDTVAIDDSLTLYHCNDRERIVNFGNFGLNKIENGSFIPDDFCHEQYLMISECDKKILISGCSHKGIINIVNWFTPDMLIGGFHFSKLPLDDKLEAYAEYLNRFSTMYYTCHCTGEMQYKFMKKFIPKLNYLSGGQVIDVDANTL